ncbi:MAG: 4Fe-4S dicluster domain-containing protein [Candidatus Bathyarchaeota archaeon]
MVNVLYVDLGRCIGCKSCEVACEMRPDNWGISKIFVDVIKEKYPVPIQCRHCESAPCLEVCPTHAIEKTPEGVVIIKQLICIGCRKCSIACPFGVIQMDSTHHIVTKCDLCIERLRDGRRPLCVTSCPARALTYGDYEKIMKEIRSKAAESLVTGGVGGGSVITVKR